ncbi:hypothetical protein [Streptomyces sp. 142MFCol3.1]|uniref:hypothetical protein n=1 Tax=Streptomyces sp. 142MFCol3.1 TaxID=1172179 RepID=UPI0004255D81|nr:hypothetical protein [Streptomyces sp. 142MFCol3.1]
MVAYRLTVIPEPHPGTAMRSTVFVDSHGGCPGRRGPVDRQEVPLSQMPAGAGDLAVRVPTELRDRLEQSSSGEAHVPVPGSPARGSGRVP